jgi:hypothetical protein
MSLALTPIPEILLLDEPISGLDMKGVNLFYKMVSNLRLNYDLTILLVSHDLNAVAKYADRMILINIRVPRTLLAFASGALLAGAGAAFQLFFRNPLAEPGIMGISSGATLGAYVQKAYASRSKKLGHERELDADPKIKADDEKRRDLILSRDYNKDGSSKHRAAIDKLSKNIDSRKKKIDPGYPKSGEAGASIRSHGIRRAIDRLTTNRMTESEDYDFTELFAGEELSEEFKLKATAMFEAAVAERVEREVQERIEFLGEAYSKYTEEIAQSAMNEQTELTEGLVEQVDGYLDYMVEQWIENNELALERGIKSELFESFMVGMKSLFEEHMITVPEGQLDVLDELNTVNDELKSKADALLAENVELKQSLKQIGRKTQIMEAASGLSDLEMDRFVTLAEGLSYVDADNFGKKLSVIRESFFDKEVASKQLIESVVSKDSYLIEETEPVQQRMDPAIAAYVSALSRTAV